MFWYSRSIEEQSHAHTPRQDCVLHSTTDHSELVGKDSDREAGSLQAPKKKSYFVAHPSEEEIFLETFGRTNTSEKSVSGTALGPGRQI